MQDSELLIERRGAVIVWTLNRPQRMNALGQGLVEALAKAVAEAESDPSIRAVVIAASGGRAFCAGADLKERKAMNEGEVRRFLDLLGAVFEDIDRLPKPVIAAVEGLALGGGLELALCCDLRVFGRKTMVGLTETSLAIIPGAGGTQRLPRLIGEARAKELILFARRVPSDEALAFGLCHRVTDDARDTGLELASELAQGAPLALAAALEAIEQGRDLPLHEALALERRCYERTLHSEDRREALLAFEQKRPAKFEGR